MESEETMAQFNNRSDNVENSIDSSIGLERSVNISYPMDICKSEDSGFHNGCDNGFLSDSSCSSGDLECGKLSCAFSNCSRWEPTSKPTRHKCVLNDYNISGHGIETISPRTFLYLQNCVTKLSLSNNNLSSLPPTMCLLKNLEELNLSFNRFYEVPDAWKSLCKLKVLKLSHNKFSEPPLCLSLGMERLVHLDLAHNFISEFVNLPRCLPSLQYLNLSHNNFMSLPLWLFGDKCRSLVELDMSFNFCFDDTIVQKQLPVLKHHQVSVLTTLRKLNISNTGCKVDMIKYISEFELLDTLHLGNVTAHHSTFNHIWDIPLSIFFDPFTIVELRLPRAGLTGLPENIFELKNLKFFDLSENFIDWLPESFGKLARLEEFIISNSGLTYLPQNFNQINCLKKLLLDHNKLTNVCRELTGLLELEWLDLYDNYLEEFPLSPEHMRSLEKFDVAANYFDVESALDSVMETGLDSTIQGESLFHIYKRQQTCLRATDTNFSVRNDGAKEYSAQKSWKSDSKSDRSDGWSEYSESLPETRNVAYRGNEEEENWDEDSTCCFEYFDPNNVTRHSLTPGTHKFGWTPPVSERWTNVPVSLILSGFVYVPAQALVPTLRCHRLDIRTLPHVEGQFSDAEEDELVEQLFTDSLLEHLKRLGMFVRNPQGPVIKRCPNCLYYDDCWHHGRWIRF